MKTPKSIFAYSVVVLLLSFQLTFAQSFDYFGFFNKYTKNVSGLNTLLCIVKFSGYCTTKPAPTFEQASQNSFTSDEEVNPYLETLPDTREIKEVKITSKQQAQISEQINDLTIPVESTSQVQTLASTCGSGTSADQASCRQGLFQGCADALYNKSEMAPECSSFKAQDYQNYLAGKAQTMQNLQTNPAYTPLPVQTSLGQVTPSTFNPGSLGSFVPNSSINSDMTPLSSREQQEISSTIQSGTQPTDFSWKDGNTNAQATYDGWIQGWSTLFAINGGRNEAGQKMNPTTAFGYNPYSPTTCIASLPYKTVDKLFGTTLDQCLKQRNLRCVGEIKKKVKGRLIEVVMLKNGKRGIFPLGDLGPAEWTGNALDLTRCAGNLIGATGKDMVRFRAAPEGSKPSGPEPK